MQMLYDLLYGYSTAQPLNREKEKWEMSNSIALLELMVVISIVGVLCSVAIPNFKKAYEDLNVRKTCGDVEVFCNGIQAYYLIKNEFPSDADRGKIVSMWKWILPSSFYRGSNLNIAPCGNGVYDFENWLHNDDYTILLNLRLVRTDLREKLREALSNLLNRPCTLISYHESVAVRFPEIPIESEMLKIPKNHRNRFY